MFGEKPKADNLDQVMCNWLKCPPVQNVPPDRGHIGPLQLSTLTCVQTALQTLRGEFQSSDRKRIFKISANTQHGSFDLIRECVHHITDCCSFCQNKPLVRYEEDATCYHTKQRRFYQLLRKYCA